MTYDFFAQTQPLTLDNLRDKEKVRQWKNKHSKPSPEWLEKLDLLPVDLDAVIATLPRLSFAIALQFTLVKPYISRDDETFYIIENPVRKDKVFKVPMVAPSGWKGALRAALWQELGKDAFEKDERIKRLFGEIRDNDTGYAGSVHFYPTFFDLIGLEVINPHDRETGVGKWPIYFECVPERAKGTFSLLYVPINVPVSAEEVAEDMTLLAQGIEAMLTVYGFGAKTSSGYGTADVGNGKLVVYDSLPSLCVETPISPTPSEPAKAPSNYQEPSGQLIADLRREDGSLTSEAEYQSTVKKQGREYTKSSRQLYEKAKKWWEREGQERWPQQQCVPVSEPMPEREPPPITTCAFRTLGELCEKAAMVAEALKEGGR